MTFMTSNSHNNRDYRLQISDYICLEAFRPPERSARCTKYQGLGRWM